ncbi:MAG: hypothetical protein GX180_08155 [Enterococcus sp.]|nr:hypothetical protein [Enterococcus sp.]
MLQLVLSDNNLSKSYEYNAEDYHNVSDALKSENAVIVAVAKIIRGISENSNKSVYKSVYQEVFNYLNKNLL